MAWELGAPFEPEAGRFAPEKNGRYVLEEALRFGEWSSHDVSFHASDGVLEAVTITFSEEGRAADRLMDLLVELCSPFTDQLDWHYPSPLGTPEPGETWDPVETGMADCGGEQDGVTVTIEGRTHRASDLHRGEIAIHLSRAENSP